MREFPPKIPMSLLGKLQEPKSSIGTGKSARPRIPKRAPTVPRYDEQVVVFQQPYPPQMNGGNREQRKAVTIRSDGSAQVLWPSGKLAIALDIEYLEGERRYRLFAGELAFPSGGTDKQCGRICTVCHIWRISVQ